MDTRRLCDLRTLSVAWKRMTIYALAFCALLIGGSASGQQSSEAGATTANSQGVGAEAVAQNAEDRTAESSSQKNQTQTSWPNAPSASQRAYSNANSLTLGERFNIYGHAVMRPYTLIGPALGAGIGQWE